MDRGVFFTADVYQASSWLLHTISYELLAILAHISRLRVPMDVTTRESIFAYGNEQSLTHEKQVRPSSTS